MLVRFWDNRVVGFLDNSKIFAHTMCKTKGVIFTEQHFAILDRENLDRLNALQHEIKDVSQSGVILVAYKKGCCGCSGSCGCK